MKKVNEVAKKLLLRTEALESKFGESKLINISKWHKYQIENNFSTEEFASFIDALHKKIILNEG